MGLALLTGIAGCQSTTRTGTPSLTLVDSVILAENDSEYVGQPSGFAAAGDGTFLISDRRVGTVHHYRHDGSPLVSIGRRGHGPGEFGSGPGFLALDGDSLLFVEDESGVKVLEYPSGAFRWSRPLLSYGLPQAAKNGTLFFNHIDREGRTTVAAVTGPSGMFTFGGPFPALLNRNRAIPEFFSFIRLGILEGDSIVLGIQSSDYLFVGSLGEGRFDSVRIPVLRRRGSRPDLLDGVTDDPSTIYPALYQPSVPWAVGVLSSGLVAYVTTDQELVSQRLIGRIHASLVDLRRHRACVDAELPGPFDPQPWVTFRADTLLLLIQDVSTSLKARTVVRRYLLADEGCGWSSSD